MEEEETKRTPSYASTLLLAMVVCALGVTAYLNHARMSAMEETLAQMRQTQTVSTEEEAEQTKGTELGEMPDVEVENVAGNVEKQDETVAGADGAVTSVSTDAAGAGAANGVGTSVNTADTAGSAGPAGNAAGASGSAAPDGTGTAGDTAAGVSGGTASDGAAASDGGAAGSADTAGALDGASGTGTEASGNTSETAATTEAQTYLKQGYYVVQKGDSLVGICRKIYQTTAMMDKLCEVNGIESCYNDVYHRGGAYASAQIYEKRNYGWK